MENKLFNKEKYIAEYELTKDEFLLLPFEERMAYVQENYGYILNSLKNVGDTKTIRGLLPYYFYPFFSLNGCTVETFDFGIEETDFNKISNRAYEVSEEAKKSLDIHKRMIAITKANVFASTLKSYYQELLNSLDNNTDISLESFDAVSLLEDITTSSFTNPDLTDENRDYILYAETYATVENINRGETMPVSTEISPIYFEYLKELGCTCEQNERVMKILK